MDVSSTDDFLNLKFSSFSLTFSDSLPAVSERACEIYGAKKGHQRL